MIKPKISKELRDRIWVEPTVPQQLVDEARKDGFRLRPTYHFQKIGYVVGDKNPKTRIMLSEYYKFSAKYGCWYRRSTRIHYHDEYEISKLGDVVIIAPFKKRTNLKKHRIVEVVKQNRV